MGKILLENMEFYAFHGFYREEQEIGGNYSVDLELDLDFGRAIDSDNLEGTVNYADVYALVEREMEIKSKLLEHVAGRILRSLFSEFEVLEKAQVKVRKINPPMGARIASVAVITEKKRDQL